MSSDTTAASPSDFGAAGRGRPRNPRVAAILALLFGTVGQVYCGRFLRATAWLLCCVIAMVVIGCLLLFLPNGRVAWILSALVILVYWAGIVVDAVLIAGHRVPADKWYQRWWCYVLYWLLASVVSSGIAAVFRSQLAEAFYLPTGSMENTLFAGDRILVDKLRYRFEPIASGDVVVFMSDNRHGYAGIPGDHPGRRLLVKRVIGVPGDKIEIRDEKVLRNGEPILEPYVLWSTPQPAQRQLPELRDTAEIVLRDGEHFVLGDNRRESFDSRMFGPVLREDIVGKVEIVFWSREAAALDPPVFRPGTQPPPAPPRRTRWERFGRRIE